MGTRRGAATYLLFVAVAAGMICSIMGGGVDQSSSPMRGRIHSFRSHLRRMQASAPSGGGGGGASPVVYHVTSYGADPTGESDSTDAILGAISDAAAAAAAAKAKGPGKEGSLMDGIVNLGGARIDLDGGNYLISRPIQLPVPGRGNFVIHGGSLTASSDFPNDGYLIDLSPSGSNGNGTGTGSSSPPEYNYEFVTLRDLFLDSNLRGGGIQVVNSLRTSIDNCYITRFNTTGIAVKGGHETYIRHSYVGQHATAGGDPHERDFSGTGIVLAGNDNAVTDVVVFSAAVGIMVLGQANTLSGVHCYNKATGFGGTGIYLKTPGLTQTRILNSYMDFAGIVAEDPVQLAISGTFFLGDAYVLLRSVRGVADGVSVVDNMFSGSGRGVEIVQLEGAFTQVDQVVIDRNSVRGMRARATVARGSVEGDNGNGTTWTADFNSVLLFPDLIRRVHYTFVTNGTSFPVHAVRSTSNNRVVIQSSAAAPAASVLLHITADQGEPVAWLPS
ncbi:polygalacturonase QRT3 isoform X2 [Andrographis paniculata]|nr:polygalacturonase QRT3 isoform X2 [Andrographis paniculata]XP_051126046.1 polygalacturonase QRT3 isoform X2 [Andrographis paniculata]